MKIPFQRFAKLLSILLFTQLILLSCSPEDPDPVEPEQEEEGMNEEEEEIVEEEETDGTLELRQNFLEVLTGFDSRTWKISSAVYIDASTTLDLSDNYGIIDDELVITALSDSNSDKTEGSILWRKRKDYDPLNGVLNDRYLLPVEIPFEIDENIQVNTTNLVLQLEGETVTGKLFTDENDRTAYVEIEITPKTTEDYKSIPTGLSFAHFSTIELAAANANTTGFIVSTATNSLYLSDRDDFNSRRRNIYKVNLSSGAKESTFIEYPGLEFSSSRLHIEREKLVVVGSAYISELDLNLTQEASTFLNGLGSQISRAGTAHVESRIYVFGQDVVPANQPTPTLKLRSYDNDQMGLMESFDFNQIRGYADGDIIDDQLYIFGGQYFEDTETGSTRVYYEDILVYNITEGVSQTLPLPRPLNETSVARYENLLMVSGNVFDQEGTKTLVIGAYDIETAIYSDIAWSLDDLNVEDVLKTEAITIYEDTMYLAVSTARGIDIYSASLN